MSIEFQQYDTHEKKNLLGSLPADDGKILVISGDTVRKFFADALLNGDNISFEIIDVPGSGKKLKISTSFVGMPSGTNNQTIRNNAGTFEATSNFTIETALIKAILKVLIDVNIDGKALQITNSSTGSAVRGIEVSSGATSMNAAARVAFFSAINGLTQELINSGATYPTQRIFKTYNSTKATLCEFVVKSSYTTSPSGADIKVQFFTDGTIKSEILTANTVLIANASKEIVSLANPGSDKMLVFQSGVLTWIDIPSGVTQIQSDWTQIDTGAVDYIKHKPTIPTLPIEITDVNGLDDELADIYIAIAGKADSGHNHNLNDLAEKSYLSLTDKPAIPENRASFLLADHTFQNLEVTPPTNPLLTSLVEIGNYAGTNTFKNSLKTGKRYFVEIVLRIPVNAEGTKFELQFNAPTGWQTPGMFFDCDQNVDFYNYAANSVDYSDVVSAGLGVPVGFLVQDTPNPYSKIRITGIIELTGSGAADGELLLFCRNTERYVPDNTQPIVFKQGSTMISTECSIN